MKFAVLVALVVVVALSTLDVVAAKSKKKQGQVCSGADKEDGAGDCRAYDGHTVVCAPTKARSASGVCMVKVTGGYAFLGKHMSSRNTRAKGELVDTLDRLGAAGFKGCIGAGLEWRDADCLTKKNKDGKGEKAVQYDEQAPEHVGDDADEELSAPAFDDDDFAEHADDAHAFSMVDAHDAAASAGDEHEDFLSSALDMLKQTGLSAPLHNE